DSSSRGSYTSYISVSPDDAGSSLAEPYLVETPEPLPPELPDPTIVAAGVPYLVSLIKRYAGTR
ncbi:hypothetical protein PENNAL_c0062G11268, partial [Penicillium nalgiovense]